MPGRPKHASDDRLNGGYLFNPTPFSDGDGAYGLFKGNFGDAIKDASAAARTDRGALLFRRSSVQISRLPFLELMLDRGFPVLGDFGAWPAIWNSK
jgi:hypothetical protein